MGIPERPHALLAELTYRCPLHCPYCSNPVRSVGGHELDTEQWEQVIREAASLGVLQIGFSGAEPLQRQDLRRLVEVSRKAGLYTNLITRGLGLTETNTAQLANSGLDNIQLSFQADEGELADRIAGVRNAHNKRGDNQCSEDSSQAGARERKPRSRWSALTAKTGRMRAPPLRHPRDACPYRARRESAMPGAPLHQETMNSIDLLWEGKTGQSSCNGT